MSFGPYNEDLSLFSSQPVNIHDKETYLVHRHRILGNSLISRFIGQ